MKKSFFIILLGALILGSSTLPAQAVEVVVHKNGTVSFYSSVQKSGEVLGDEDESENEQESEVEDEQESESERASREQEAQREAAKKREELARETAKKLREISRENAKNLRPDVTDKKTEIRIKREGNKIKTQLETKQASSSGKARFKKITEVETGDDISLEVPKQLKLLKDEREQENEAITKALNERSADSNGTVEIRSDIDENGQQHLELNSGDTTADIHNSEVVVNPVTNSFTIASSSGTNRRLNHLPDQALVRLQELLNLQSATDEQPPLDIETKEDGSVVYTTQAVKTKKLFGLFNRQIETRVELNDETGEVTETELPAPTAWERFLNRFSL